MGTSVHGEAGEGVSVKVWWRLVCKVHTGCLDILVHDSDGGCMRSIIPLCAHDACQRTNVDANNDGVGSPISALWGPAFVAFTCYSYCATPIASMPRTLGMACMNMTHILQIAPVTSLP